MVESTESQGIEAEVQELARIVNNEDFKTKQQDFFKDNCMKFDAEEENKLEYTVIHKQYETLVEEEIKTQMGDEKFAKLEQGMPDYISTKREATQSQEVFEALDILSQLGDFDVFKTAMLTKKG